MNASATPDNNGRIAYLDALRVICSFLVIVNHTYGFIGSHWNNAPIRFTSFLFFFTSKIAVPIFLMISGYTLLTKTDTIFKTLSRFMRIAVTLIVFSFVYEVYQYLCGDIAELNVLHFLNRIYTEPVTTAFWYLYAYAGILLMVPFLQRMVKGMTRSDFLFFFAVSFFFIGLWPMIVEYTPVSDYSHRFDLPLFGAHICYLLLGYFLHMYGCKQVPTLALVLVGGICVIMSTTITDHRFVSTAGARYLFMDNIALVPIVLSSICAFCLVSRFPFSQRTAAMMRRLGRHSFGIYLLGDLAISVLFPLVNVFLNHLHPLFAVVLFQVCCWLLALALSMALRHVPLIRKLL